MIKKKNKQRGKSLLRENVNLALRLSFSKRRGGDGVSLISDQPAPSGHYHDQKHPHILPLNSPLTFISSNSNLI